MSANFMQGVVDQCFDRGLSIDEATAVLESAVAREATKSAAFQRGFQSVVEQQPENIRRKCAHLMGDPSIPPLLLHAVLSHPL